MHFASGRPTDPASLAPGAARTGAVLRGASLAGRDLRGIVLAGADLRGADLSGADLSGADLSDVDLDGARLGGARLHGARLLRSRAPDVDLRGADLTEVDLAGAACRRARLDRADLSGARGAGLRLDDAHLDGASCHRVRWERVVLDGASIEGTEFTDAHLHRAAVWGTTGVAVWSGADLTGADLRGVRLDHLLGAGARLAGARLSPGQALLHETALRAAGWAPGPVDRLILLVAEPSRPELAEIHLPTPSPRTAVEDGARAELRALARRRALEARLQSAQGPAKAAAAAALALESLRGWQEAVLGGEGEVDEVAGSGEEFVSELRGREQRWARLGLDRDTRARVAARARRVRPPVPGEHPLVRAARAAAQGARVLAVGRTEGAAPISEEARDFGDEAAERERALAADRIRRETQARRTARVAQEARMRALAGVPAPPSLSARVLTGVRRLRTAGDEDLTIGPGADLRQRQLDDRNLAGANLTGALLAGAGLVGADLRGADLRGADLRGADLTAARLQEARLDGALLDDAEFDQAELAGANLSNAQVTGARFSSARGLRPELRAELARRGADLGLQEDGLLVRTAGWAMASALCLVVGVYLAARFTSPSELDAAALEHAASQAQQAGDPAQAAVRFRALADQAQSADDEVHYLLEAASALVDAGDVAGALDALDRAGGVARGTPLEGRVLLRLAQVQAGGGLTDAALESFTRALGRNDLTPAEQAAAVLGLDRALPESRRGEVPAVESELLASASTDPQRAALGMALADGWAAQGRVDRARAVMEEALGGVVAVADQVPMRLRLARLEADEGNADGALAMYRALIALPDGVGKEARLGAAELLAGRGADAEADALLEELRVSGDADLAARADLAAAAIARRRGQDEVAMAALRRVLGATDVEPRLIDDARIELARILVGADPAAAAAMADESPQLRDEIRLGQARALRESGKQAEARAIWVEMSDDPTTGADARLQAQLALADLEVQERDVDGALRRYEALMEQTGSVSVRQRIQLGAAAAMLAGGRVQDAEARYLALLATAQGDVADQCRLGLGRAAELRGKVEEATQRYREVGAGEGIWAVEALYALGELRERTGDWDEAIAAYRLAASRPGGESGRKADVSIALARVLQETGDPEAAALYASMLDAPDPVVRVQARLAVADQALGADPARARTLYEEALAESAPGEARAHARGGWLRATVALGESDQGLDRIRAWLETEPDDALRGELAVAAVRALRAEGRFDDAIGIAERYAEDGGFELGMELAGTLREAGRPADAAERLRRLLPLGAEDEVWRGELLADALLDAGRLDEADAAFTALRAIPGGAAAGALGNARVARERGDPAAALAALEECDDPRAPAERALALEGLGRWDEAETAWGRLALAADLETRSAGALGLARARLNRDDAAGALAALEGLDRVDPGYVLTHAQVRGEALLALGRIDAARAVYTELTGDAESRAVGLLGQAECALLSGDPAGAERLFAAAGDAIADRYYVARGLAGQVRARAEAGDTAGATTLLQQLRADYADQPDAIAVAATAVP